MPSKEKNKQIVGNIGLYYISYCLSKLGWNVMITARNARGPDILIYDSKGIRRFTIQVKSYSKRVNALITLDTIPMNDFLVVCNKVETKMGIYVLRKDILKSESDIIRHSKNKKTHYITPTNYERLGKSLEQVIGKGHPD